MSAALVLAAALPFAAAAEDQPAFTRPEIAPVVFERPNGAPTMGKFRTGRPEQAMPFGAGNLSGMVSFGVDSLEVHLSKADYLAPGISGREHELISPGHVSVRVPDLGTNFVFRQTMDMEHGEVRVDLRTPSGDIGFVLAGDRETGALVIDVRDGRKKRAPKRVAYDNWRAGTVKTTALATSAGLWRLSESDGPSGRFYQTVVRSGDVAAAGFRVEIVSSAGASAAEADDRAKAALAALGRTSAGELEKRRRAWWADYWSRGWIHLEGDERATFLERCWYVNLYSWANVGYGDIPPKFNGGPGLIYDDSRCWGAGLWYQNTRELIWPCCAAGHPEFAKSLLLFYDSFLPYMKKMMGAGNPKARDGLLGGTRLMETSPIDASPVANTNSPTARPDWRRPYAPVSAEDRAKAAEMRRRAAAAYTTHVFSSGTELLQQMFDYVRYTGDKSFEPIVATWLREQTELYLSLLELEDDGLYHIHCTNVNESWWKKDDSIVDLAAARFCLAQTAALGGRFGFPTELVADAKAHLAKLAPYPTLGDYKYKPTWTRDISGVQPGDRLWQPYRSLTNGTKKSNCEYNQLYLVFPFAMAHADFPDGDPVRARAIATYRHLPEATSGGYGWSPVAIDAVRLHLANAADVVYSHARNTCHWPFGGGKSPAAALYPGCPVEDAPYFDSMGVIQTGIQEMLLQSHAEEPDPQLDKGGVLKLIPDVPKNWSGAFRLHARGGIVVECIFEKGRVVRERRTPAAAEPVRAAPRAKLRAASPFGDGMVLQRDRLVPVWGVAEPGAKVTVEFAGQSVSAVAGADGRWRAGLAPLEASKTPRVLRIRDDSGERLSFGDVLVGEVWLASGQSNMELPLWSEMPRYRDAKGVMVAQATHLPNVRVGNIPIAWRGSDEPRQFARKGFLWMKAEPETLRSCRKVSAIAFWYARELYLALDVPVAVLAVYQGGTRIEQWTPKQAVQDPVKGSGELFNEYIAPVAPYAVRGFLWYQGESNGPAGYCSKMHAFYSSITNIFENGSMPMYFVQIPGNLPRALEQARFAAEEPNAEMSVIADVFNPFDEHPSRKEIVAQRLALHALARDYGFSDIVHRSPSPTGATATGDVVTVRFSDARSLYIYNDDWSMTNSFEIAGADGRYSPAEILNMATQTNKQGAVRAKIDGGISPGPELMLRAAGVSGPKRVRYLWNWSKLGNIFSEVNLPVQPFEIEVR